MGAVPLGRLVALYPHSVFGVDITPIVAVETGEGVHGARNYHEFSLLVRITAKSIVWVARIETYKQW